jgi:hypothetical protein
MGQENTQCERAMQWVALSAKLVVSMVAKAGGACLDIDHTVSSHKALQRPESSSSRQASNLSRL